jgi:hypothetical protein
MLEHDDIRKKAEKYFLIGIVLLTLAYGLFRAYPLLLGPRITLYYPNEGDSVASTSFEVSGHVDKVKEITLQGRPIPIDTDGHFKEIITASSPFTTIVLTAVDFYGKEITKVVRVIPQH